MIVIHPKPLTVRLTSGQFKKVKVMARVGEQRPVPGAPNHVDRTVSWIAFDATGKAIYGAEISEASADFVRKVVNEDVLFAIQADHAEVIAGDTSRPEVRPVPGVLDLRPLTRAEVDEEDKVIEAAKQKAEEIIEDFNKGGPPAQRFGNSLAIEPKHFDSEVNRAVDAMVAMFTREAGELDTPAMRRARFMAQHVALSLLFNAVIDRAIPESAGQMHSDLARVQYERRTDVERLGAMIDLWTRTVDQGASTHDA